MNSSIHYSDIFVLSKMFFPKATQMILFGNKEDINAYPDESNIIKIDNVQKFISEIQKQKEPTAVFNFCNPSLSVYTNDTQVEGIINFKPDAKNGYTQRFSYINNPDTTIRWIYPTNSKAPVFINFYNNTGLKAKVFKSAAKVLSKVGGLGMISNGYFTIDCSAVYLPDADDYAYFTGTVGQDRKVILASQSDGVCTHFTKMPIGEKSQELVQNEYKQLQALQFVNFKNISLPKAKRTVHGIQLTNIKPAQSIDSSKIQDIHLKALDELYKQHTEIKIIAETDAWETVLDALDFFEEMPSIKNNLPVEKVNKLITHCKKMAFILQEEEVMTGWSHGDFTPWNMYATNDKLYLYDWELSQKDMPLLVDICHYVFQKNILINRSTFAEINQEMKDLVSKNTELKSILYKYGMRWNTHYAFYLLNIVCYYLPRYIQQGHLHEQANWLVNTWLDAMDALPAQVTVGQAAR